MSNMTKANKKRYTAIDVKVMNYILQAIPNDIYNSVDACKDAQKIKKLNELTELCTKLSDKVTSLEDDLKQTKNIYGKDFTKLVKKVKHLEAKLKSTTERRKARMVVFDDKEDLTDDDLQRRSIIEEIDLAKILADASREKVKTYTRRRNTDSSRDSTAGGLFSTTEELDEREETNNIDWNTVAEQVQERHYDEIRPIFEEEYNKIQTLFKKDTEVEKTKTKRIAEEILLQESFKKLRTPEASRSEPIQEQPTEEPKELSEELKKMMEIVPVEEIKA
ncbi:hypothetical protein Tco_1524048 [Tanacetum coccineum]